MPEPLRADEKNTNPTSLQKRGSKVHDDDTKGKKVDAIMMTVHEICPAQKVEDGVAEFLPML